jgi:protein-S-isoprenylcysteine O-methyltransferase Ste14
MSLLTLLPVIFFISEFALLLFRRSKSKGSTGGDKNSLLLFWIVIPVCITLGVMLTWYTSPLTGNKSIAYTGAAVVFAGLMIRWLAIWQLGKAFTVNIAIASDQQLKTDGLYGIVRHPSYTGLLMVVTGLALCLDNLWSILVIVVPIVLVLAYRIRIEEKMLTGAFGAQYEQYSRHTKRLIPLIY